MKNYGGITRHLAAIPFELFMLGTAVVMATQGNWKYLAISLFTFSISFIPLGIERWYHVKIPALLQFIYVAFVFASMFSGEVLAMYARYWPWDDIMHWVSGFVLGLAIALGLTVLLDRHKNLYMPIWFAALTIVCVNVTVEVLWEIVEFASDQWFHTFSQGNDLVDTMMDLVDGAAGGLILAIIWVLYAKQKNTFIFGWIINQFKRLNNMK